MTRTQLRLLDVLPRSEPNDGSLVDEAFAVVAQQVVSDALPEAAIPVEDVTGTLFLPICRR